MHAPDAVFPPPFPVYFSRRHYSLSLSPWSALAPAVALFPLLALRLFINQRSFIMITTRESTRVRSVLEDQFNREKKNPLKPSYLSPPFRGLSVSMTIARPELDSSQSTGRSRGNWKREYSLFLVLRAHYILERKRPFYMGTTKNRMN